MKNGKTLSWLWRVCAGDKLKILWLTLVQILLGASSVMAAWLLRGIIDCAVGKDAEGFWLFAGAMIALTAGQIVLRAVLRYLSEACRSSLENRFKHRLFGVLLEKDYSHVNARHSGEWMNRLTSDTAVTADGMTDILPGLCGMLVKLAGALGMLVVLLPRLSPVIFGGGIGLILLTWIFRKRLKELHKIIQESDGVLRAFLTEQLGAMLVLRAFGKQGAAWREGKEKMDAHRAARMRRNHFSNLCNVGFGTAIHGAYVFAPSSVDTVFCREV